MAKEVEKVFISIVGPKGQMSVYAHPDKPLSAAVDEAFKFHKQKRTPKHKAVRSPDGKKLSLSKSVKANGLKFNEVVYVS